MLGSGEVDSGSLEQIQSALWDISSSAHMNQQQQQLSPDGAQGSALYCLEVTVPWGNSNL